MSDTLNYRVDPSGVERIRTVAEELQNAFATSALKAAINAIQSSATRIPNLTSTLQSGEWQAVRETIKRIKIPTVSNARKEALLSSYEQWGRLGWTLDPDEELVALFSSDPGQNKVADREALKVVKIDAIIDATLKNPRVKCSDFNEAIRDFRAKCYKSCGLILFSLIDAQLIRLQKRKTGSNKRLEVGLGAVRKAKKQSGFNKHKEWLLLALFYTNIFACLESMFSNTNDFKLQPSVINRNLAAHGMMRNKVTRKSCIQLFLLYYNMLEMLDLLYS